MKKLLLTISSSFLFANVFAFNIINSSNATISFYCKPSGNYFTLSTGNQNSCQANDTSIEYGTFPNNPYSILDSTVNFNMEFVPNGVHIPAGFLPSVTPDWPNYYYVYATVSGLKSNDNIYFQKFSVLFPTGYINKGM